MTKPFSRYDFLRQPDGGWAWQRTNPDGSAIYLSARHKTMGDTTADAIAHGFRPTVDRWIIDSLHAVTYFEPGRPPKTMSKLVVSSEVGPDLVSVPGGLP